MAMFIKVFHSVGRRSLAAANAQPTRSQSWPGHSLSGPAADDGENATMHARTPSLVTMTGDGS